MTQGYFFQDQTPEQEDLARQQAMADQLIKRGTGQISNQPGAGINSFGSQILGAYLSKRLGQKAKDLETTREGDYSRALGNLIGPSDNSTWDPGSGTDAQGQPAPLAVSPRVGAPMSARLTATGNPDLAKQLGPQLAAQMFNRDAQANAPITPAEQARMAQQQQQFDTQQFAAQQERDESKRRFNVGESDKLIAGVDQSTNNLLASERQRRLDDPAYKASVAAAEANARLPAEKELAGVRSDASPNAWQILQDPTTGKQYRYNTANHQATDLAGAPYTPGGAGKIGSNQARSPAAMYLQKYQAEHPDATSADLADVAATFGAQQKAVRDFATGPEGNIITRLNTAVSHLDTLQKIGMALDNGDVQAYNSLRNEFRTQFGSELPTNFNAAMPIVAGEVSKAIVGTQGGTREDRAELERTLTDAASKRQLSGATGTQKQLLQGQLTSRRKQYEVSTGRKDFDKFLSGETQKELGIDAGGAVALPNSPVAPGGAQSGWTDIGGGSRIRLKP